MPFDPYHKWLGIPPDEQPPDHYRLMGIARFESDPEVIDAAANRQMAYVQSFAGGDRTAESQKLLNELAAARLCLLDPERRKLYDATLRKTASPTPSPPIVGARASDPPIRKAATRQQDNRTLDRREIPNGKEVAKRRHPVDPPSPIQSRSSGDIVSDLEPDDLERAGPILKRLSFQDSPRRNTRRLLGWLVPVSALSIAVLLYASVGSIKDHAQRPNPGESSIAKAISSDDDAPTLPSQAVPVISSSTESVTQKIAEEPEIRKPRPPHIPEDAQEFGGHFYKFYGGSVSWPEAEGYCRHLKGRLVSLESPAEREFVAGLKGDGRVVWVGGYRDRSSTWRWLSGPEIAKGEIHADESGLNYAAYTVGSLLNSRTRSGHSPGYAKPLIHGYVCEWDGDLSSPSVTLPFDLKETEPVGEICRLTGHSEVVACVAISPDGSFVITGGADKSIRCWDVRTAGISWEKRHLDSIPLALYVDHSTSDVYVVTANQILVIASHTGVARSSRPLGSGSVKYASFSKQGNLFITISREGEGDIFITDCKRNLILRKIKRPYGANIGLISPDERLAIYGEYALDSFAFRTEATKAGLVRHWGYFSAADFSPDSSTLVTGSGKLWEKGRNFVGDRAVKLWDVNTGREIATFQDHHDWIWATIVLPDGDRIMSGGGGNPDDWHGHRAGADNVIRLWNRKSGTVMRRFEGHRAAVLSLAASSDGKYVVSGSADKTARLWRLP